mmetsp:Transcript_27999/g.24701  ORF Transcript_27999/g.24701 Transcript_27999/m.24701 type:complete len:101 (+) Transcript_27999:580-882(+)
MIREKIAKSLPEEPKEGAPDAILVIFRLPDGERVQRRFSNKDKAEDLYNFVNTQELKFEGDSGKWDLMQPRPLLVLDDKEKALCEYFEGSDHEVILVREL